MAHVNGLYGHIQRNNNKAAVLIAAFLALFLVTQFAVRLIIFWPMAQAIANGETVPLVKESDPLTWRLLGFHVGDKQDFKSVTEPDGAVAVPEPETAPQPPEQTGPQQTGPRGPARMTDALWLMVTRTHHLFLQCLALMAFALYYILTSARRTGLLIQFATRARPLQRRDYPELFNLVENLAVTAGLPCPAIELIESPKLNAYATGLTPASARLGLTTGLIATLDRRELEAVIAHEITHIRNRDTRLMAITKGCADLVLEQPRQYWQAIRNSDRASAIPRFVRIGLMVVFLLPPILITLILNPATYAIMIGIPAVAGLFALLCKAMMHQSREFIADAGAVELTKNPASLISALRKMAGRDATLSDNMVAQAMMFSSPDGGWLSTHPTFDARIEAIVVHAGVQPHELHAVPPRRTATVPPARIAAATAGATFGRRPARPMREPSGAAQAARSFGLRATPANVWDDTLPLPPPSRGMQAPDGEPEPTLWQRIEMEGFEAYLKKRPLLLMAFLAAAAIVLQLTARVMAVFGFQ